MAERRTPPLVAGAVLLTPKHRRSGNLKGPWLRRGPAARLLVGGLLVLSVLLPAVPASAKPSGDNGRIVYARQDNTLGDTIAFMIDPVTHEQRRLLPGSAAECPAWSPNGDRIFVGAGSDGEILRADGSLDHDLLPPEGFFLGCAHWSPDGHRLARAGFSDSDPTVAGVYTVRASDDRDLHRLTAGPDDPTDYSPDGRHIVFIRTDPHRPAGADKALFTVDTDGTSLRRITPWGLVSGISGSWSPNGRWIAFTGQGAVYLVRPDGVVLRQLRLETGGRPYYAVSVGWSPDGTRLALALSVGSEGAVNIYTASAAGARLQRLTSQTRFNPHDLEDPVDWGPRRNP